MSKRVATDGLFDRAADSYGSVGPDHFGYFAEELVERVGLPSGADVLDVATGTGAVLAAIVRRANHGRLVGIDSSAAMLARARLRLSRFDVELLEMDALRLDFASGAFDVVLCSFGLQSFGSPDDALREMHRVLRPGGRLGLVYPRGWHFLCDERWRWQVEVFGRYGIDVGMTEAEPTELARLVERARFEGTDVHEAGFPLVFRTEDEWWSWSWSHGTRVLFEALSRDSLEELRRDLEHGLRDWCQDESGSITGRLDAFVVTARASNQM